MTDERHRPMLTRTRTHATTTLSEVGRIERVLWVLVAVGLVGDLLTTYYGLQLGLTESNPVARAAMTQFGFGAMIALKLVAVGIGVVCRGLLSGRHGALVPAGLAVPWLAASVVNLSLYATALS